MTGSTLGTHAFNEMNSTASDFFFLTRDEESPDGAKTPIPVCHPHCCEAL